MEEGILDSKRNTTGMSTYCQCEAFHIDARGLRREIAEEREVGSKDKGKAIVCFSVRGRPGLSSKEGKGDETNDRRIQKVCVGKRAGSESRKVKNCEIREKSRDKGKGEWKWAENEIEEVNEFNYLNFIFQRNGKVKAHLREIGGAMKEYRE